uniref:hypothetical protein n=1 Tax=Oceanithermus sp. TaxID=2268145 RepID=UPI00257D1768
LGAPAAPGVGSGVGVERQQVGQLQTQLQAPEAAVGGQQPSVRARGQAGLLLVGQPREGAQPKPAQVVGAGADGRLLAADRSFGGLKLRLELPYLLALYPDAAPYAWGGGRAELRYREGWPLWAEAYGVRGRPRYGYEARTAREGAGFEAGRTLRASASYRRAVRYDLAAGAVSREERSYAAGLNYDAAWGTLAAAWRREQRRDSAGAPLGGDERWTLAATRAGNEAELAWWRGWDAAGNPGYSELRLAYRPAAPGCAGGWTLAPSLGWDLLRGRVSRAGLELTLNDCCFAWTLGYQGVFLPQRPGEAAGHQVRFGVRLR